MNYIVLTDNSDDWETQNVVQSDNKLTDLIVIYSKLLT